MNTLAVTDSGPDLARLIAHVIVSGSLAAAETGPDTIGSTLMQQIARALEPLAAGGAWPGRNTTEPTVYPYITFFRVIRPNNLTVDGPSDVQPTRVQVDMFSLRYSEAAALARAVRDRMLAVFSIGSIDEQDFPPDPAVDAFRCSIDFNVWSAD